MFSISVNYTKFFPPAKNQGSCLSCWAFSAVSLVEYHMWKRNKKWSYSEQNLVDCSSLDHGCSGGWPTNALYYIRDHGISSGKNYIYKGVQETCLRNASKFKPILRIPNVCEVVLNGREDLLKNIIAKFGPVAGAICRSIVAFYLKFFKNSILSKRSND